MIAERQNIVDHPVSSLASFTSRPNLKKVHKAVERDTVEYIKIDRSTKWRSITSEVHLVFKE